jgi:uncharacterized protein
MAALSADICNRMLYSIQQSPAKAVLSPCTGVCTLRSDGLCAGCFRSGDEIAAWSSLDDASRQRLMDVVLPAREAVG